MNRFKYKEKEYRVDFQGFLLDYNEWDEDFAEGMASEAEIMDGLNAQHWNVIRYIRRTFKDTGECPLFSTQSIYMTGRWSKCFVHPGTPAMNYPAERSISTFWNQSVSNRKRGSQQP